ncbi:hypothetical protein KIN20_014351 [Parelaphostrongylus tenuis]|uniref:Uncharacterized protein n=1 Tax=Parelaphostrongylus tenuis TaxID=148309 RepID=A0AAD5MX87_PARTN|nr:hypothetical protein KIN20_014351 [Parelaphostrongylus tenuis]
MEPQLIASSGVFSTILLEAYAANEVISSSFGHVCLAKKDVCMPLSRSRKTASSAHKRRDLVMKIALLKKRKGQLMEKRTDDNNGPIVDEDVVVNRCKHEKEEEKEVIGEASDGSQSRKSSASTMDSNLADLSGLNEQFSKEKVGLVTVTLLNEF